MWCCSNNLFFSRGLPQVSRFPGDLVVFSWRESELFAALRVLGGMKRWSWDLPQPEP